MIATSWTAGASTFPRGGDSVWRNRGVGAVARLVLLAIVLAVAGCASGARDADPDLGLVDDELSDPLESMNRGFFAFNTTADKYVLRPVSIVYDTIVPGPIQYNIRSILNHISLPVILLNDLLQGEWDRAGDTAARLFINTVVLGLGDIATDLGAPPHSEDFGQTLAVWGYKDGGPYLVLPFIGPSNVRDAIGFGVDAGLDPVGYLLTIEQSLARAGMTAIDFRVRNGREIDELERSSIDYYAAVRSLYRQKRASDIRNGAPDDMAPGPGIGEADQPPVPLTARRTDQPILTN